MTTALLNVLKKIVSQYGGVETLPDARRVKALLADLAAAEPRPQKNALIAGLEQGFAAMLQNVPAHERGTAKSKLAERLNREEGLDPALCADTLDLLEAVVFGEGPQEQMKIICRNCGKELQADWKICPSCGTAGEEGEGNPACPGSPVCPACGTALPEGAQFCCFCGAAVAHEASRNTLPQQQAPTPPARQAEEVWRELQTLKGHTNRVTSVAYSPDGRRIASGAWDKTIKIWDTESGQVLQTLKGHTNWVDSVVYSPDGRRIASGAGDRTVRIWDAESGHELHTLTSGGISVAYCPDGRRIASGTWGCRDNTVSIWDVESGRKLQTLKGHINCVISVAYRPDGNRIASGSEDGTIKIWGKE
jgi:uncharacterized Zn finger protein (UPF0148 family)